MGQSPDILPSPWKKKKHMKVGVNSKRRNNVFVQSGITVGAESKSHFVMVTVTEGPEMGGWTGVQGDCETSKMGWFAYKYIFISRRIVKLKLSDSRWVL